MGQTCDDLGCARKALSGYQRVVINIQNYQGENTTCIQSFTITGR